jgi:hypothetical protein
VAKAHTNHSVSMPPLDGASPNARDSATILEALMTLQRASVDWQRSMHELARNCGCTDGNPTGAPMTSIPVGRFVRSTTSVSKVVRAIREACSVLELHVLPFDRARLGSVIDSIDEIVARGQMLVVRAGLQNLREVLPSVSPIPLATDPVRELLRTFPNGIDEVIRCAELELDRVASFWTQLRHERATGPDGKGGLFIPDYRRLHRCAVVAAQREMNAMIDHPRFGTFLREGIHHRQLPHVRTYCAWIAMALQVRLSAELSLVPTEAVGTEMDTRPSAIHQPVGA